MMSPTKSEQRRVRAFRRPREPRNKGRQQPKSARHRQLLALNRGEQAADWDPFGSRLGSCQRIELNSLTRRGSWAQILSLRWLTRSICPVRVWGCPKLVAKDALRVVETPGSRLHFKIKRVCRPAFPRKPEIIMFSDVDPLGARPVITPDPWADLRFKRTS